MQEEIRKFLAQATFHSSCAAIVRDYAEASLEQSLQSQRMAMEAQQRSEATRRLAEQARAQAASLRETKRVPTERQAVPSGDSHIHPLRSASLTTHPSGHRPA